MLSSIFKKSQKKNIKEYLYRGKLNSEIPSSLINGLVYYVYLFLNEGFLLKQIKEISSIGQIVANETDLDNIRKDLMSGKFKGCYETKAFETEKNYIDFLQFTLDNGESYAVAYNSPGDYLGKYVGILWILKLKEKLEIGQLPNTHFDFRRE